MYKRLGTYIVYLHHDGQRIHLMSHKKEGIFSVTAAPSREGQRLGPTPDPDSG